jgi:hypothetical protein
MFRPGVLLIQIWLQQNQPVQSAVGVVYGF